MLRQIGMMTLFLIGITPDHRSDAQETNRREPLHEEVLTIIKDSCVSCHSGEKAEGGLDLDAFQTTEDAAQEPQVWWKVLKNIHAGTMPPEGEPRLSAEQKQKVGYWVKSHVFGLDRENLDPGNSVVRRLNRVEYGNTLSDLMGIRFDSTVLFPPDDSGHGFDNLGDALTFSPLLLEKYLLAARQVVDQSVPTVSKIIPRMEFSGRDFERTKGDSRGNVLDGKMEHHVEKSVTMEEPGEYVVHVDVKLHGSFDFDPARYRVEFAIDNEMRSDEEYGWDENKLVSKRFQENWKEGEHRLSFRLTPVSTEKGEAKEAPNQDGTHVRFEIASIIVEGPLGTNKRVHPRNYERFFTRDEPPASIEEKRLYAAEVLRRFANRAYRYPVDSVTVDRMVQVAEEHYRQPNVTFESGIAQAMVCVLASPRFLFRMESSALPDTPLPITPVPNATQSNGTTPRFGMVDEWTLASRLSYFIWSTMPDDELFQLAQEGKLRAQLPQQVKRMMRDPRSQQFVGNFVGQWLRTRDVTQTSIDPIVVLGFQKEYDELREQFRGRFRRRGQGDFISPEDEKQRTRFRELRDIADRFNADLKRAIRRETEMCFEYIVREDQSLLDLIDCNYTFLNERLAQHYSIPGVRGDEMRRVELPPDSPRGGVLTHASMLLVTSNPTRTSPVKRGLYILDNLLGTPAPPAPGPVPELEDSAEKFGGREPSLRELLSVHRESPLCASCHSRMDPLGLALENFNALGMWRDEEKGNPIDPSGKLITGETFSDLKGLKTLLRKDHSSDFYRCITQKLLTFAIGRGLEFTDEQTIDLIVEKVQEDDGKFSALLQGIVESAPFQKRRFATTSLTHKE